MIKTERNKAKNLDLKAIIQHMFSEVFLNWQ